MKKAVLYFSVFFLSAIIFLVACKHDIEPGGQQGDPCAGVNIVLNIDKVDPTAGQSNGSITATATGSTGFTFSLNGGPFQSTGNFTGLDSGSYIITVKNAAGCAQTGSVTLTEQNSDPCAGVNIILNLTKTDP
jgi:hypothetical protein